MWFKKDETKKKAEDRQFELDYNIDYKAHKYRITKYEENLINLGGTCACYY